MASGYGKKSLKQKFNNGVSSARSMFLRVALLGGIVGVPAYWNYGTYEEKEQKITQCIDNTKHVYEPVKSSDDMYGTPYTPTETKPPKIEGNYKIKTNQGSFIIEKSRLHLQSQDDAKQLFESMCSTYGYYGDGYSNTGRTFVIKSYGKDVGGNWKPNIVSVREVPQEELRQREEAKQRAAEAEKQRLAEAEKEKQRLAELAQQQAQPQTSQSATSATGAAQPATVVQQGLSGRVQTVDIVFRGNVIQLTVPEEVVGKITIQSVTPLATAPRPPGP